jgi:CheY-like chemotaxis protein
MTDETRLRAFEPFFTTKARDRGTGLGLAMVYGLARQSGGTVTLDSRVGAGTTVRLYLPRARLGTQAIDGSTGRNVIEAGPRSRILLVDDDDAVRDVVGMILRGFGHEVVEADGGQTALDILELDRRFDLLIVDLAMPNMHGAVFGTRARHVVPGIAILFVTGYTDAHWLRDVAAEHLLRKPFSRVDLAQKLRQILEARPAPTTPRRTDAVRGGH